MNLHNYLIYCAVYVVALATPGPGVVAVVARALKSGFGATVPAVAGSVVGDLILMTLSAFGLALVAKALGGLFLLVKLGGAGYLVFLGCRYWTSREDGKSSASAAGARQTFTSQMSLTLGNPKAIAFFVALLPNIVDLKRLDAPGYLALSAATFVLIPAVELSYAAGAAHFQGALTSNNARRRLNRSAAVLMTGAGIVVALT